MSSSALCHEELTGACVASLMVMAAHSDDGDDNGDGEQYERDSSS